MVDYSKLGKASIRKGKAFERNVASALQERGFKARRTAQFDGENGHDITINLPFNFECKAVESLNVYNAYLQAKGDSFKQDPVTYPIVVHKKSNKETLATMSFQHFVDLLQWALGYVDEFNTLDLGEIRKIFMENKRKEVEAKEML